MTSAATSPSQSPATAQLSEQGVAIWLDDLSRERIATGNLAELVESHGVVGVTTNPTIFASALAKGSQYDDQLRELGAPADDEALARSVWAIVTRDVREACDILRPVYDATDGQDGRVSIEVDPGLARDTEGTVALAHELWDAVDRPNLYIKIPATVEGLPAITAAIAAGISVNVTLIFSLERYRAVIDAYLDGIEQALAAGRDVSGIGSVASFFISRVDSAVDAALGELGSEPAEDLRGQVAIANARLAYEIHAETLDSERWQALAASGAHPQRPLWASTGVKDPAYPDTRYVTELVAPGVVNTMPAATLEAVADHGEITGDTITGTYADSRATLDSLALVGVSLEDITRQLEEEGLSKFIASWTELLGTVREGLTNPASPASPDSPDSSS